MVVTQSAISPLPNLSPTEQIADYSSFLKNLRSSGLSIFEAGDITEPFFSVPGKRIGINGINPRNAVTGSKWIGADVTNLQVFEYHAADEMEADAKRVSPDGSTFRFDNTVINVEWIAPPHFYKVGRIIVIYVETDDGTIFSLLEKMFGSQFAGR